MLKRSRQDGSDLDRSTGLASVFGSLPDESNRPPPEPATVPGDGPATPREPTLDEIEQRLAEMAATGTDDETDDDHADEAVTSRIGSDPDDGADSAEGGSVPVAATVAGSDATTELTEWGAGPGWSSDEAPPPPEAPAEWGAGPEFGDGPPPDPPYVRRRRRIWPWFVWVGILLAPAAIIGSCTAITAALNPRPVQAADDFIAALDEGRIDDAYAMLCPALRDTVPFATFSSEVAGADRITGYRSFSAPTPLLDLEVVTSTIELDPGESVVGTFEVTNANGRWMICRFPSLPAAP